MGSLYLHEGKEDNKGQNGQSRREQRSGSREKQAESDPSASVACGRVRKHLKRKRLDDDTALVEVQ